MSRLYTLAAAFGRSVFPPGARLPSAPLVFFTVALVASLQVPSSLLLRAGHVSAGLIVNEVVAIAGVPLLILWLLRYDWRRALPLGHPSWQALAYVVVLTIGAVIVIDYATAASELVLPLPPEVEAQFDLVMQAASPAAVVWKLAVLCIIPGICEELFFRGYCQTALTARWGRSAGILVTAVIFAVLHGNPWYVHLYVLLGLLFGWVFAVTGSLWASILCHILNNAWTFLNHTRGFELPMEDAAPWVNAGVLACGATFFLASAIMLRRQMKAGS